MRGTLGLPALGAGAHSLPHLPRLHQALVLGPTGLFLRRCGLGAPVTCLKITTPEAPSVARCNLRVYARDLHRCGRSSAIVISTEGR